MKFFPRPPLAIPAVTALATLLVLTLATGCTPRYTVNAETLLGPTERVVERHNRGLALDPALSELERDIFQAEADELLGLVQDAAESPVRD